MLTPKKNDIIYYNKSLSFQNKEKEKYVIQLHTINKELEHQNQEIAKLTAELVNSKKEK
jgi:hypothetical protein